MTSDPSSTLPAGRRRKILLPGLGVVLAVAAVLFVVAGRHAFLSPSDNEVACPKANVLLIVIDGLRPDHLGAYGYDKPTSPFLDRLAKRSILFERAISQGSWTKPSIGSLFTSLYPHEHGAMRRKTALSCTSATLAETLRTEGYFTVAIHGNPFLDAKFGFDRGFDSYSNVSNMPAANLVERFLNMPGLGTNRPYFAYLHFMEAHLPYKAPAVFRERFSTNYSGPLGNRIGTRRAIVEMKDSEITTADKAHVVSLYDAEICYADAMIADLFGGMKRRGLLDNTIVIVTADHGDEFWEHGEFEHGHSMYNELLHVPLVMLHPRGLSAGSRVEQTVRLIDVFPTITRWLGLKRAAGQRGVDLTPAIARGRNLGLVAFSEGVLYGAEQKAVQTSTHKLIVNDKTGKRTLYDLSADPRETVPLDRPAFARRLARYLEKAAGAASPTGKPPASVEIDPALEEQLRSIGYAK